MPCYSYREEADIISAEKRELKRDLDKVTRMLCFLLSGGANKLFDERLTPEIRAWWKEHQALDRKRGKK